MLTTTVEQVQRDFPTLAVAVLRDSDGLNWTEISSQVNDVPVAHGGPDRSARLLLSDTGIMHFQVLRREIFCSSLTSRDDLQNYCIQLASRKFTYCASVSSAEFQFALSQQLNPVSKLYLEQDIPFKCYKSKKCLVWFQKGNLFPRDRCSACKMWIGKLKLKMQARQQKSAIASTSKIDCNCPLSKLSTENRKAHLRSSRYHKHLSPNKLKRLEGSASKHLDVDLNELQVEELREVVTAINRDYKLELESVFVTASATCSPEFGQLCKKLWIRDQRQN